MRDQTQDNNPVMSSPALFPLLAKEPKVAVVRFSRSLYEKRLEETKASGYLVVVITGLID